MKTKLFMLEGNCGWLIYCCWSLSIKDAENVYKNHFRNPAALMKNKYELKTNYPNVIISSRHKC